MFLMYLQGRGRGLIFLSFDFFHSLSVFQNGPSLLKRSTENISYFKILSAAAKSLQSCPTLCDPTDSSATPQTAAHQAPPSLGFSRQEHWSGLPLDGDCSHEKQISPLGTQSGATRVHEYSKKVRAENGE